VKFLHWEGKTSFIYILKHLVNISAVFAENIADRARSNGNYTPDHAKEWDEVSMRRFARMVIHWMENVWNI